MGLCGSHQLDQGAWEHSLEVLTAGKELESKENKKNKICLELLREVRGRVALKPRCDVEGQMIGGPGCPRTSSCAWAFPQHLPGNSNFPLWNMGAMLLGPAWEQFEKQKRACTMSRMTLGPGESAMRGKTSILLSGVLPSLYHQSQAGPSNGSASGL